MLAADCRKTIAQATPRELYNAVSKAALDLAADAWKRAPGKRVAYLSAEFLVGRLVYANLLNMGRLGEVQQMLLDAGVDANVFEEIEDAALGNGGLGRLAACFLDSAATQGVPLDGYGIRYQYGLFRQYFEDGFQKETADDWQRFGDPWSVRREEDAVTVQFGGQAVRAVPYDTPVIGYGMKTVNTLRLWQAEPFQAFDFNLFNAQKYAAAVRERDAAEDISRVLYPNDDTDAGKRLRLKQQYFFSSASLQDMVRAYRAAHGGDFTHFADAYAVQLNDTHPTVAIPELLRLLVEEAGMRFADAVQVAHDTFAYTNHTIMPEALEKWDQKLFRGVLPRVYPYVKKLDALLRRTLEQRGVPMGEVSRYAILEDGMVHMARMAIFATHSTNGVARLHTEILKDTALHEWYELYPERFNNKTNGVTQRRWLALANPELAALLHDVGKPDCFTAGKDGIGHFYQHAIVGAEMTRSILRRLKFDNDTTARVVTLVRWHDRQIEPTAKAVKRALQQFGQETFFDLLALKRADNRGQAPAYAARQADYDRLAAIAAEILASGACFSRKDLAITGRDLMAAGMPA